jgi:hypothetical protein
MFIYAGNMRKRKLVPYVRQARAEAYIIQLLIYMQIWIQGGGWVDEGI